ncbi:vWA domain-containing protein [Brevibacillus fluminis]|uniref:vWA domain-containing protein n=1 Tax=Brevibacillus fluminis TaxID=511487 RepID=UPI003F899170
MQWMALGNLGFLAIIPVILALYLLKRKYEDQEVSSTLLWQKTLQNWEVTRPWQKLRRSLLLFLQLLAALLLVLALIRPAIPAEGAVTDHTVLVIDVSASMLTREGDATRIELAKAGARKLIETMGAKQTVTLLAAGREPQVLLAKSSDKAALLGKLDSLAATLGTSDLRAALSLAQAIAATEAGSGIIWYGDGGSERITGMDAGTAGSSFRFVQEGRTDENSAIGAFVTQPGEQGTDGLLRIDNYGKKAKTGKATIYDGEGQLVETSDFSVEPNDSRSLPFHSLPPGPAYRAVISVDGDGLAQDNEAWSVPFAAQKARAVLVSPEGNRFLSQVLKTGNLLSVETMDKLPTKADGAADLWIFDRVVPDVLPPGNVMLIGPQRKTAWLPVLGERELTHEAQAAPDEPLLKYVDWKDVHVAQAAALGEMPGMHSLVKSGEIDLVRSGTINNQRAVIVSFDLHDSDFPLRPAFPIFMQNALSWLLPKQSSPITGAQPGEAVTIPLTPGASSRTLVLPDGSQEKIAAEGSSWLLQVPQQAGLYRLEEEVGGARQGRYFSVRPALAESDITPRVMSVASAASGGQKGDAAQSAATTAGSRELATWLAALALLAVFAEWRVYQRGY